MEEWKEYKLGEVIEKVIDNRGKSAPKSEEKFQPIIEINSLGEREPNYGMVRKWVSKETYNTWFRSGHPIVGDILVPTVGTIGIVSLMCENKGCIAQNIIALRVNQKAYNLYIYYYLKSSYIKQQLLNLNIGGVQPSIKVPHLLNLDISLPTLHTQQKIANILSSLDDKIEVNRRINEQLEELAQALFKSWFVDFEPFKDGEFVESELGMIPKGWKVDYISIFLIS
jgi:type I restriction enzyme S subunit